MKFVVITSYLASKGGVARYVWELSEYLASQGDQVLLISLYADRTLYDSKNNLQVIDLADKNTLPQSINFWLKLNKLRKKLSFLINKECPSVILFNDFPATLLVENKKYEIPTICYTHDIHMLYTDTYINNLPTKTRVLWRFLRLFVRNMDRKKWKEFDHILCNSKFLGKYILKYYYRESKVIYPGSNTKLFKPNKNLRKRAITSLGDIKLRRADLLISAAEILKKNRDDFEIWIVGDKGENSKFLKNLVKEKNLEHIVKFFGKVHDEKLAEIYAESLVVTHLVKEAPFGLIVTEAMACETPVIAWKPGGPEEIIQHMKNGFLIDENDQKELVKYLEIILNEPELSYQMGKNARKRICELFDGEKNYQKIRDFMKDI